MTSARWKFIEEAIWRIEIQLDCAYCEDGGEDEKTKELAEGFLRDVTRLRRRLMRAFGNPEQRQMYG